MATQTKSTAAVLPKQNAHSQLRTFSSAASISILTFTSTQAHPHFLLPTWSNTFYTVPRDVCRQVVTGSMGKFVRNDDKELRERIRGFGKEPPKPWTVFEEGGIDVCAQ